MSFEKEEYVNISKRSQDDDKVNISSLSAKKGARYSESSGAKAKSKSTQNSKSAEYKTPKGIMATRIISGILSFLLIVVGGIMVYGESKINNFSNYEAIDRDATLPLGNKDDSSDKTKPQNNPQNQDQNPQNINTDVSDSQLLSHRNVLNIMLYGTDDAGSLSDTMILMSIDSGKQKIKLTSFLRDTYVSIPGGISHKLNYAFAAGGVSLSIQTIEKNYGVRIDRYAAVNFTAFKEIVNILGGVEVELSQNEIGYINAQVQYNGQSDYLYAEPGLVKLNGQQALWYARNRGGTFGDVTYGGDDWDRTDRQRKFISAVINQMKDASLSEIVDVVNEVGQYVTTDIKKSEITDIFLKHAITFLSYDIEQCSMPADGNWYYGWNDAGSVILVDDWNQARLDIGKFIYEDRLSVN